MFEHLATVAQVEKYVGDALAPKATFKLPGGSSPYRTLDRMRQSNARLIEVFGTDVILPKKTSGLAKQQHEEQLSVKLPF